MLFWTWRRSGTFAGLIVGKLLKLKSISSLVDEVVRMREFRDGLIETPTQFRFVLNALDILEDSSSRDSSTTNCNGHYNELVSIPYSAFVLLLLLCCVSSLLCLFLFFLKYRSQVSAERGYLLKSDS